MNSEFKIQNSKFLVTGGAGFIGSNIVEYLVEQGAGKVVILDDLSNGFEENLRSFSGKEIEFYKGSCNDIPLLTKAIAGVDYIFHQAALGSVPRSIENPVATHNANATGFLSVLEAARRNKVKRIVYASSSSVYGDIEDIPKIEGRIGKPLSPYAVSKLVNEFYADIFVRTYGMEIIGLRYFNIFGPRQDPKGAYAAAIPLFMDALLHNKPVFINGDGEQTRDFTFVQNAVQANVKAMFANNEEAIGNVFNIAMGKSISINKLFELLKSLTGSSVSAQYRPERRGDVRQSRADISRAERVLGYKPEIGLEEGLARTLSWFKGAK